MWRMQALGWDLNWRTNLLSLCGLIPYSFIELGFLHVVVSKIFVVVHLISLCDFTETTFVYVINIIIFAGVS